MLTTPACQSVSVSPFSCAGNAVTLTPGEVATFTNSYTVTQADIDAGTTLTDSATTTGTPSSGPPVPTVTPSTQSQTVTQSPALTIVKLANKSVVSAAGQVVTNTFTVTNTGNETLASVGVTDTQTVGTGVLTTPACQSVSVSPFSCAGNAVTLTPGEVATFTNSYTVTQADIDAGTTLTDSATTTGTPSSGPPVPTVTPSTQSQTVTQSPALTIVKLANKSVVSAAGQVVTNTFTVTNTGNETLASVGVTDTQTVGTGVLTTPACQSVSVSPFSCAGNAVTLTPGEVATFTNSYTVTQADIDAGTTLTDSATTTGTPSSGPPVPTVTPSTQSQTVTQSPALTIVKLANKSVVSAAGQVVTNTFTVTNTGNVTFTSVGVTDTQTARHRRAHDPGLPSSR